MKLGIEAGEHTKTLATEAGIRGVPISMEELAEKGPAGVIEPLAVDGLSVCQIGAFGVNFLSDDAAGQEPQLTNLVKAIPMAADTGCPYIVINGGNHHPSGFGAADPRNFEPEAIDILARRLEPFLTLAEKHGAFLSIEPYLKTTICGPEPFARLKAKVGSDALRANIDPSSLYSFWDVMDPTSMVNKVCAGFAGSYGLVHIKEIGLDEGFHLHMGLTPLSKGRTDWTTFFKSIEPHMPDDSWVILEHVLSLEEGRESIALVRAAAAAAGINLN